MTPDLPAKLGRYELLGEMGRGGMGRVLRALDPEIGREVAIKVLLDEAGRDPDALARFVAEARITGQLEHPNIVPVYDVGFAEDGRVFYVMKRVEGTGLDRVMTQRPADWSLHRLLMAFQAVCAAVSYAHHRGVLHQDLKPHNIILGAFGEVLVLDWGLAALLGAGLQVSLVERVPRGVVGTPGYIAPERIAAPDEPPTPLADQWSLGAVLYTLLCGRPPYEGVSTRALLEATLRGPPEDVRLRAPEVEIPYALGEICARAMAADPTQRFADVVALQSAILEFQEGSERRARALGLVAEADALVPRIAARQAEAARLRVEAEALLVGVKASDPIDRKREAWALQDAALARTRERDLDLVVWAQRLQGALQLVPDLHEAHVRLAKHHRAALEEAELRHDPGAAARAEWLLRLHDRGHHRRFLAGDGRLTLWTDPPGASVVIRRLVLEDRQLVPGPARSIERAPLHELALPPGSYLLEIEAPGYASVRYPVLLPRAGVWDGVPPGGSEPFAIPLPRAEALGPDDVIVPAGWFLAGGDPEAPDALSARRVWVDGFVCRRYPTTNAEYAIFLNRLLDQGLADEAERCQPRDVHRPLHPSHGAPVFARGRDGRFCAPAGVDPGRWALLPVTGVDHHSALCYAASVGWRLPDELEREKAARGVDGRLYPWGDAFDPAFANIAASQALPSAVPVTDFPLDRSVYGVSGLAGNVRDLCGNRWTEQGSAGDGERLVLRPAAPDVDYVSVRGGAWVSVASASRAATRFGDPASIRPNTRGIRLVRSLG